MVFGFMLKGPSEHVLLIAIHKPCWVIPSKVDHVILNWRLESSSLHS